MQARGLEGAIALSAHHGEMGLSYRRDADRYFNRAIFFSGALLFAHFLKVHPRHADVFGLDVDVSNLVIVYGALAAVLLHNLFQSLFAMMAGEALVPFQPNAVFFRGILRGLKRRQRRRRRRQSPKWLKREAALRYYAMVAAIIPYAFVALTLVVVATICAVGDVWNLGVLLWSEPGAS